MNQHPHLVVVGAGFAGLSAVRGLRRAPLRITLIDRHNFHLFQPLLYQVATGGLSPGDIAWPIRALLRGQANVQVWMGAAVAADLARRTLTLADGARLDFDYLVLAPGARTSYFHHPEWSARAPGLKSIEDALEIRRRIFLAYERAERSLDPDARRDLLTFVIVGGGPTGVELAGALADIAQRILVDSFRNIRPQQTRVVLLEGGPRLLPEFPPALSARATAALTALGIEVRVNARATRIGDDAIAITERGAEHTVRAATILWAAGVRPSPLARSLGVPLSPHGTVVVHPDLSLPGFPECFAAGDFACFPTAGGQPLPGLAPVALQQGRALARIIAADLAGRPRPQFHYRDKGELATVGRAYAIASVAGLKLSGRLAWWLWAFVHILYLIGFRSRLAVALNWTWNYLRRQPAAQLITAVEDESSIAESDAA